MILPDVNVLVYAHREDARDHARYRSWLTGVVNGAQAFGLSDLVLSGFVRVVTHPRVFAVPTPIERALEFAAAVRSAESRVRVVPGERHWEIFDGLCREAGARGNLVPDAWFAALAIESGSDWITTDRDYARFPGLRWRHPFDGAG
jgi:toxin-antitoxin system PIN domain toxin